MAPGEAPGRAAVAGQSLEQPTPAVVATPPAEEGAPSPPIQVKSGDEFSIKFESNRTTGYQWELAEPTDPKVVTLVRRVYRGPQATPAPVAAVGVVGEEVWTFKALGKGNAKVAFRYARPGEKDSPPAKAAAFSVVVQ